MVVNTDGTLNARIIGSVATSGGTFTGSVSGTVGASIIGQLPTGTGVLGSITALQGTSPWNIAGSVAAIQSGPRTTSIVGGASVFQAGPWTTSVVGSVTALQGTNPWIVTGSVQGSFTPSGNQSVSGTVGASAIGLTPVSVSNFPTNQNVSGSVVAFQGTNPWVITGSVQGSFSPAANQSVSGTVQVDVRGSIAAVIIGGSIATATTNSSVMLLNSANTIGSVATLQGTNPWIVTGSVQGVMSVLGTVPVTQAAASNPWIITGSVQGSFSPAANQSVSGTVQVDVRGSVAVAIISGSIAASFTPPANQSVSGTVQADIRGSVAAFIIGGSIATATTNSSVMLLNGANVIGSVAALQGTNPWIITSSVAGGLFPISGSVAATITNTNVNVGGSVIAFQGTSPFVVNFQNSSIIAIQSGSVVSLSVGSTITVLQAPSIVGTYAEDSASANLDKGLFILGVRNDTLASVTSADLDYGAMSIGPSGEVITSNSPLTKWVQGTADFRNGNAGASIVVVAAQGTSVFTYITGVQIANMGSASVLVTLASAGTTLGYTIAPAGGGSNIYYPNALKTLTNGPFAASISGIASVLISAQGFTSKS